MLLFTWIALAVGCFVIVRGALDMRERRYAWGAVGIVGGLALILTPIPTQAVKFDLTPTTTNRKG